MINRPTDGMLQDTEKVLHEKLKNNSVSIQVDESTDFTIKSYVVTLVRFIKDGEIQENFSCCKKLPETSKGQDIVISSFLETKGVPWENCVSICTVGAPSMVGSIRGFTYLVNVVTLSQHVALFTDRCWF
jgi:hypothetical protein